MFTIFEHGGKLCHASVTSSTKMLANPVRLHIDLALLSHWLLSKGLKICRTTVDFFYLSELARKSNNDFDFCQHTCGNFGHMAKIIWSNFCCPARKYPHEIWLYSAEWLEIRSLKMLTDWWTTDGRRRPV